ncbi:hypothetical protein [Prosthecobacter sp.]|uniref:hypothetical protein n=1 Tax=Prosthecobacter sp. TaxID=1965333 RepID=UPI0037831DB7
MMKYLDPLRFFLFASLCFTAALPLSAQDKAKPAPSAEGEWSLRVYRYPASELLGGFVSSEQGQLTAPAMPPANANEEEVAKFIRRSHFVLDQHLKIAGVTLPPGSLAVFDPKNKTLALRSTGLTHERVAALAAEAERMMPKLISINVQILEAEAATVNEAVKQVKAQADHAAAWSALDALVSQKKASYVGDLRMETKSGTRSSLVRGEGRTYVTEMIVDEERRSGIAMEEREAGTRLELEPTIGADGETIDLTYSLEHHYRPPQEHWDKISAAGEKLVESPNIDFHNAHVVTGITLLSGMTKLLGIWKPEDLAEPERASHLQAAFLKAHIASLLPALDTRVEQLLRTHGERIEKTPSAPPPEPPGATKGIITRSFHITDALLTMGDSGGAAAASDPFAAAGAAPAAPMANEARLTMRITAVEILKSKGIPFPEGSSANFKPSTGELLVRNTPENMKLVEDYISSLKQYAPRNLATTLHIIEADAATIRRLAASTAATTDHTAAWQEVEQGVAQNKIRLLRSTFLESKSGNRSSFESGRELIYVTETSSDAQERSARPAVHNDDKEAKTTQNNISNIHVTNGRSPRFTSAAEMRRVGLRFEMEGTVGYSEPDAVELTTNICYDYASPVISDNAGQPDAKTIRPLNHSIQVHQAQCTVGTTLASGTHRLLSIWKPEGTPEFDKADVLQAAFLSIDIVPVERSKKP